MADPSTPTRRRLAAIQVLLIAVSMVLTPFGAMPVQAKPAMQTEAPVVEVPPVEAAPVEEPAVGEAPVVPMALPQPPPSTPFYFRPDSGGENDIDKSSLNNQSDLSAYGVNGTGLANTTTQYGWKWDNPYLAGNNSQDVCVYLSSTTSGTSDPNAAEYAVCYSIITDAAGNITSQYADAWYCPTYATADASKGGQKCFGSADTNLPAGVDIQAEYLLTLNVAQQFSTDPDLDSQAILDVWAVLVSRK